MRYIPGVGMRAVRSAPALRKHVHIQEDLPERSRRGCIHLPSGISTSRFFHFVGGAADHVQVLALPVAVFPAAARSGDAKIGSSQRMGVGQDGVHGLRRPPRRRVRPRGSGRRFQSALRWSHRHAHHQHGVAWSANSSRVASSARFRAGAGRWRVRQHVQHNIRCTRSGWPGGCAAIRRPRAWLRKRLSVSNPGRRYRKPAGRDFFQDAFRYGAVALIRGNRCPSSFNPFQRAFHRQWAISMMFYRPRHASVPAAARLPPQSGQGCRS